MVDTLRIKRRLSPGAVGPPAVAQMQNAEIAYNESDDTLYYGKGLGAGTASTSVIPIAGAGAFIRKTGDTISGGLIFGAGIDSAVNSTALRVTLFGSPTAGYGFGVTNNRLNYNSPVSSAQVFLVAGVDKVTVNTAGITMGSATDITLNRDPTPGSMQAATASYVDGAMVRAGGPFLALSGGTVAGATVFSSGGVTMSGSNASGIALSLVNNSASGVVLTGTYTSNAIRLPTGGSIGFNGGATRNLYWDNINDTPFGLKWSTGGVAAPNPVITLTDAGYVNAASYYADNSSGSNRAVRMLTSGVLNWMVGANVTATPLDGTNTGSDYDISGYSDTGVLIANYVRITRSTGLATFNRGIAFGTQLAPGTPPVPTDLSRHIGLYGGANSTYGFSITSNRLNYVSFATHVFMTSGVDRVTISSTGLALTAGSATDITLARDPAAGAGGALMATTRQYVDTRVAASAAAVIPTIAALRAATNVTLTTSSCVVHSYAGTTGKGGGTFIYVSSDTTTADNGGTLIVDASARRWRRVDSDGWLNVMWFGAVGNGVANDGPAIQAAINAAYAMGGGTVFFPPGTYSHTSTLTVWESGVTLRGSGHDANHDWTPPWPTNANTRPVTALLWSGALGGTQIKVMPTSTGVNTWSDSGAALGGCGVVDMNLFAGSLSNGYATAADYGVEARAVKDCEFSFFGLEHRKAALLLGTLDRNSGPEDGQRNSSASFCRIPYLGYRGVAAGAGGALRMEGIGTNSGNAYNNLFGMINVLHNNGHAIDLANCDNNVFDTVRIQRLPAGAGVGIYFRDSAIADGPARANVFNLVSSGQGGTSSEATRAFPPYENKIMVYNPDENSTPLYPLIGNGSTLYYNRSKETGGCCFTVYVGADMTLPSGTWTTVRFNTLTEDPANWFLVNPAQSAWRWQPRYPGRYDISASVLVDVTQAAGGRQLQINKNANVTIARSISIIRGIGQETITINGSVQLDGKNDYVQIYVWQDSGTNGTVKLSDCTFFMGSRAL